MNKGNRLDKSTQYLVELLRAFGELNVRLSQEPVAGSLSHLSVISYVKHQMDMAKMPFPFDEARKKNKRNINKSLKRGHITVIVNEAVMEYMDAYIEIIGDADPDVSKNRKKIYEWIEEKQKWLDKTYPDFTGDELLPFIDVPNRPIKEDVEELDPQKLKFCVAQLADMGYEIIDGMSKMKELFWDIAIRHTPIGFHMSKAIESVTTNDLAMNYLKSHIVPFNKLMKKRLEDPKLGIEEQGLRVLYGRGYKSYVQHVAKIREEAKEEIEDVKRSVGRNNKVAKRLRILLENPQSNLQDCYDLTREESIKQYLMWYRIWTRPFKQWVVRALEEQRYTEPGALDLFKQKVEEHNAFIESVSEKLADEKSSEQ